MSPGVKHTPLCECGQPRNGRRRDYGCKRCSEMEAERSFNASPAGRILAALRHQDGMLVSEIAAEIGDVGSHVTSRLSYMLKTGTVEQEWVRGVGHVYRVKQEKRRKGRAA